MEKEKEEDVWSRKIIGWQRSRNTLKIGPPSDPTFWNRSNCLIYLPFRKLEIEKKDRNLQYFRFKSPVDHQCHWDHQILMDRQSP